MSYRTVIQLMDTLTDRLKTSAPKDEIFEDAFGDLEELLHETQDASYHQSQSALVQARFQRLHGQLSVLSDALQPEAYQHQTWRTLTELLAVSKHVASLTPARASNEGEGLDLDDVVILLNQDPELLYEQAQQEQLADPNSIIGAYLQAAALLCMGKSTRALVEASALALRYPARHVHTIAAAAHARQNRLDAAIHDALQGLHCRLEARRPHASHRIAGLRTLSEQEAEAVRQVNVALVQHVLHWCDGPAWTEANRLVFVGLLAPSLTQARHMLEQGLDDATPPWQEAAHCGLARCARWRCAFDDAEDLLDEVDTPFSRMERTFIERDRSLLLAGQVELTGFGVHVQLSRTKHSILCSFNGQGTLIDEHKERDAHQLADLLKDYAVSWIGTGFHPTVLQQGVVEEPPEDEPILTEPEAVFDVEYFFELYNDEDLLGIHRYTDGIIAQHPHAPTPWGVKSLVHLIDGNWQQAAAASRQGVLRSGCRALASPQILHPLSEGDYGQALMLAMQNLSLRLRSATPQTPIQLPAFPHITASEGELLDQIELNTWRVLEEVINAQQPEETGQELELRLLSALMVPNPATTVVELEELMPELAANLGLQAAACVGIARWRRHEGSIDMANHWLRRAERLLPSLSHVQQERQRLRRDRALMTETEITLRGFGVTIDLQRSERLLHRHFTLDRTGQTHALTGWIEDSQPDAEAIAIRDVAVSWLECGFTLLSDAPTE